MPRIDFALHPAALAFGLFCAILAGIAIASMVYATAIQDSTRSSSSASSGEDREPFVPESEGGLPQRETSPVDADGAGSSDGLGTNGSGSSRSAASSTRRN